MYFVSYVCLFKVSVRTVAICAVFSFFFAKLISPIIYNKLIYRVNLSEPFVGVSV